MSEKLKPARVVIGGPAGCVGYTPEETRVLNEILHGGVSLRNTVVHRALRIMCQAVLSNPEGGYPGTLLELEKSFGISGEVQKPSPVPTSASGHRPVPESFAAEGDIEGTPDWLRDSGKTMPAEQNSPQVNSASPVVQDADQEAVAEDDPLRAEQREMASQFIG